jgi:hypothetical protein
MTVMVFILAKIGQGIMQKATSTYAFWFHLRSTPGNLEIERKEPSVLMTGHQ